jgi:predicted alpha-1,2-mannosidase
MISRRDLLTSVTATGLAAAGPFTAKARTNPTADYLQFVDPMIGTGGHGHVFPGACVPFGMVQLSPDTDNNRWDSCSGYHHDDATILGFSHTHLSGTGVGDLMDVLVVPATGALRLDPRTLDAPQGGYRARFDHADEIARPGYYRVLLRDSGIEAELTATPRAGLHRYTFPVGEAFHILVDLQHGFQDPTGTPTKLSDAHLKLVGNDTLVGGRRVAQWAAGREIYFALKLSRPFASAQLFNNDLAVDGTELAGASLKCVMAYDSTDTSLLVKVGLSAVSIDNALRNLDSEIPDFDFDRVRSAAGRAWGSQLSTIRVEGPDSANLAIFYTSLYHASIAPSLFSDVDGRYRGMDTAVHQLQPGQNNYSTYSLWDTYRTLHPLQTLIAPERQRDFVRNLVTMATESPYGPAIWPLQGIETHCMIGWHSAVLIAEAATKGYTEIDYKKAWTIYKKLAFDTQKPGLDSYRSLGFVACDLDDQSVSKTLEYAYDDWAMARIADAAGDPDSARRLRERSGNYRNIFDAKTQFTRPRFKNGSWPEPFDPRNMGHKPAEFWDYTESNAWQATFLNQHDIYGYMVLFGGEKAFEARIDSLFNASSELPADAPPDMSGLVGQYVHGNEPSHHIAYLYTYAGAAYKTQARVRDLLRTQYHAAPDGLAGNEDCGQMSAWYVMSALGLYPVDPVSGIYVIGSPLFRTAEIPLAMGKVLRITASHSQDDMPYVKSLTWKGKPYSKTWISHAELMTGGELSFSMSAKPNLAFGADKADRPPSFTIA